MKQASKKTASKKQPVKKAPAKKVAPKKVAAKSAPVTVVAPATPKPKKEKAPCKPFDNGKLHPELIVDIKELLKSFYIPTWQRKLSNMLRDAIIQNTFKTETGEDKAYNSIGRGTIIECMAGVEQLARHFSMIKFVKGRPNILHADAQGIINALDKICTFRDDDGVRTLRYAADVEDTFYNAFKVVNIYRCYETKANIEIEDFEYDIKAINALTNIASTYIRRWCDYLSAKEAKEQAAAPVDATGNTAQVEDGNQAPPAE